MKRKIVTLVVLVTAAWALAACGPGSVQSQQSTSVMSSEPPAASPSVSPSPASNPNMPPAGAIKSGLRSIGYTEGTAVVEFVRYGDITWN